MFGLGFPELAVIGLIVVILFGTRKLPELGSGLGKAISNFRKSYKDAEAIDVTPSNQDQQKSDQDKASSKDQS